jgi:hypothetical protein
LCWWSALVAASPLIFPLASNDDDGVEFDHEARAAVSAVLDPVVPATGLAEAIAEAYAGFCRGYRDLLCAIAAHDQCEAYRMLGVRKEEDYLCRTFDLGWITARDWTREARVVGAHPEIGERLATGEMSIDRFRKMAELVALQSPDSIRPQGPFGDGPDDGPPADPAPDPIDDPAPDEAPTPEPPAPVSTAEELLAMVEEMTARQLAAKAAAARAEEARRRDRDRTRHVEIVRVDGEGRLILRGGQLYDDDAAVVWAAFEDFANRVGKNPETGEWDPLAMRHADALRAMADAYLARRERELGHPLVIFHSSAGIVCGDEDGWAAVGADHSPLTADTIRRLACFAKINLAVDDPDGNPLFLGRTQRLASWQQEAMVVWRDGACRGCGSTVGLEVHHMEEWTAEFGLTDVDRLIVVCRTCHHLHHDRQWRFDGEPNGEVRFADPIGGVRSRTRPHPRFDKRPRPPKDWLSRPPDEPDEPDAEAHERASTLW